MKAARDAAAPKWLIRYAASQSERDVLTMCVFSHPADVWPRPSEADPNIFEAFGSNGEQIQLDDLSFGNGDAAVDGSRTRNTYVSCLELHGP